MKTRVMNVALGTMLVLLSFQAKALDLGRSAGNAPVPTAADDLRAAERGDKVAQFRTGVCYVSGCDGVAEDYLRAAQWLRLSADQCYDEAMAELAALYYNGTGVKKDLAEAEKWTQKVAEQDHCEAQFGLAKIYIEQHRDSKDDEEAYFWLLVAGRKEGKIEVREFADMLAVVTEVQERLLTPQQISAVRKRAAKWKPAPCQSATAAPKKFECRSGKRKIKGHQVIIDCEGKDGINEEWTKNGVDDREDGPAWILRDPVTGETRAEQWFRNGKLDRQDGPAHIVYDSLTGQPALQGWVRKGKTFEPSDELRSAWLKKNNEHFLPLPK